MNHSRIYTVALATLAAFAGASAAILLSGIHEGPDSTRSSLFPAWALSLIGVANLTYALGITAALGTRTLLPKTAGVVTHVLNWLLLPAFPGGTVIGLYGLLIVEKRFPFPSGRSVEPS